MGNIAKVKAEGILEAMNENGIKIAQAEGGTLEFKTEIGKRYRLIFQDNQQINCMIEPSYHMCGGKGMVVYR